MTELNPASGHLALKAVSVSCSARLHIALVSLSLQDGTVSDQFHELGALPAEVDSSLGLLIFAQMLSEKS